MENNIVKMAILPKVIYKFNTMVSKTSTAFGKMKKTIVKFIWYRNRSSIILKRKNKLAGLTPPDSKTYHKAMVIKIL